MSLKLSQEELSEFFADGRVIVANYRQAYLVEKHTCANCYGFRPIMKVRNGLPYTARGRFVAVTPETFDKWNNQENKP